MTRRDRASARRAKASSIIKYISAREVAILTGLQPNRGGFILCPIHADHSPSLHLLEHGYYCFGCGAKGGLLDLVVALGRARNRVSAARWLEERVRHG